MAVSKRVRWQVLERDRFTCQYCGWGAPDVRLQVDHIVPRSQGGQDDVTNLVAACFDCNMGKTDRHLSDAYGSVIREVEHLMGGGMTVQEAYQEASDVRLSILNELETHMSVGWSHYFYYATDHAWPPTYSVFRLVELYGVEAMEDAYYQTAERLDTRNVKYSVDHILQAARHYLETHYHQRERCI